MGNRESSGKPSGYRPPENPGMVDAGAPLRESPRLEPFPIPHSRMSYLLSTDSTARKASCGISTRPTCFIRFLPSFCFSNSFFLRVTSPP